MISMTDAAKIVLKGLFRPDSAVKDAQAQFDIGTKTAIQKAGLKLDKVSMTDAVQSGDFTKIIKSTLLEPNIIVTTNAIYTDVIDQVNNVLVDSWVAYYIQIFDILTKLEGFDANTTIDLMSTNLYTLSDMKDRIEDKMFDRGFDLLNKGIEEIKSKLSKEQMEFSLETDKHLHNLKLDSSHMFLNTQEWNNIKMAEKIERIRPFVKNTLGLEAGNTNTTQALLADNKQLFKAMFDPQDGTLVKTLTRQFNLVLRCSSSNVEARIKNNASADYKRSGFPGNNSVSPERIEQLNKINEALKGYKKGEEPKELLEAKNLLEKDIKLQSHMNSKSRDDLGIPRQSFDFEIPIICRASVKVVNIEEIATLMRSNDMSKSFFARVKEFKAGAISLWDLIWCDDLITQYKSQKLGKNSTLLNSLEEQNTAATLRKYFTGTKGFETCYNSVVMTKDEANYISKVFGKNIIDGKGKDEFLTSMNAYMACYLDTNNERAEIVMKRIPGSSNVQWKAFERRKDNHSNVMDFFKAISGGTAIRF